MKPLHKGFLLGSAVMLALALVIGHQHGQFNRKIGKLHGVKDGQIQLIKILGEHFPPHTDEQQGKFIFGTKTYSIWLVETGGIQTLQVNATD